MHDNAVDSTFTYETLGSMFDTKLYHLSLLIYLLLGDSIWDFVFVKVRFQFNAILYQWTEQN